MSEDMKKEPMGDDELDAISGGKSSKVGKGGKGGKGGSDEAKYACPFCTELFTTKKAMQAHIEQYHSKLR